MRLSRNCEKDHGSTEIRDCIEGRDVRASIIKERWMADRKTPKSYTESAEMMKIRENALMIKIAAWATGNMASNANNAGNSSKNRILSIVLNSRKLINEIE